MSKNYFEYKENETHSLFSFEKILVIANYTEDKYVVSFANGVYCLISNKSAKNL